MSCNRVHDSYLQKRNIIRRKWRGKLASKNSSSRKEETGKDRKTKAEERRRKRERQKSRKAESERESTDRERENKKETGFVQGPLFQRKLGN